jgi:beta-N-acetylhexosaminidase
MTVLRRQVGQLLIAGLEGTELSALERSWLKAVAPGGVILFRRNIEDASQTFLLLAEADSLFATPLFRCVDLEGGLVDRLRDLIAPMPSLAAVAASHKKSSYAKHGELIAREAHALGFNTVFAPVLDLALPVSQPVMRTRTYFAAPEDVATYADGFLKGLESSGILSCGKHFPGLGAGALDSHHATPIIERPWEELWRNDLLPYRELKSRLSMVMVSHASYPATGDNQPASISPHWITEVLARRIGYRGLVVSDDMEMGGILTQVSIEEAVVRAVRAGTHLIEICKDPALVLRGYEALLAEAERSTAFRRMVEVAYRKIVKAKRRFAMALPNRPPSPSQIERLRKQISAFGASLPDPAVEVSR